MAQINAVLVDRLAAATALAQSNIPAAKTAWNQIFNDPQLGGMANVATIMLHLFSNTNTPQIQRIKVAKAIDLMFFHIPEFKTIALGPPSATVGLNHFKYFGLYPYPVGPLTKLVTIGCGPAIFAADPNIASQLKANCSSMINDLRCNSLNLIGVFARKVPAFAACCATPGFAKILGEFVDSSSRIPRNNAMIAIGSIAQSVPNFGEMMVNTNPKLAKMIVSECKPSMFPEAFARIPINHVMSSASFCLLHMVNNYPTFGKMLVDADPDFPKVLAKLLSNPRETTLQNSVMCFSKLVVKVPEFRESLQRSCNLGKLAVDLCKLMEHKSIGIRVNTVLSMADTCSYMKDFIPHLLAADPQHLPQNLHSFCMTQNKGEMPKLNTYTLIRILSSYDPVFSNAVANIALKEAPKLCEDVQSLLTSDVEKHKVMVKLGTIAYSFPGAATRIMLEVCPVLPRVLISLISSPTTDVQSGACYCAARFFDRDASAFISALKGHETVCIDDCLKILFNPDSNASLTLNLTLLLGRFVDKAGETFAPMIINHTGDPGQLANLLCHLVRNGKTEPVQSNSCFLIARLVEKSPDFAQVVVAVDPTIGDKIVQVNLSSALPDSITSGCFLIAMLVKYAPGYSEYLLERNPTLPMRLVGVLTGLMFVPKAHASLAVGVMCEKCPRFQTLILDADPELAVHLCNVLQTKSKSHQKHASYALAVLTRNVPGFAKNCNDELLVALSNISEQQQQPLYEESVEDEKKQANQMRECIRQVIRNVLMTDDWKDDNDGAPWDDDNDCLTFNDDDDDDTSSVYTVNDVDPLVIG